ncbi:MAG: hypothetical protein HIU91_04530 [Acidobacteria bacterium]|nr:hypothetical protein [Acidobacteriota bacterium]
MTRRYAMMMAEERMLRSLLSILLFAVTILPTVAPMLSMGASAESSLPACCRRDGKHHCAMSADERAMLVGEDGASKTLRVSAVCDMYPQGHRALAAVHLSGYVPEMRADRVVGAVREPSAASRAECLRRISFDRSRQKRGPPVDSLSS